MTAYISSPFSEEQQRQLIVLLKEFRDCKLGITTRCLDWIGSSSSIDFQSRRMESNRREGWLTIGRKQRH
jgi:hypothetical protein